MNKPNSSVPAGPVAKLLLLVFLASGTMLFVASCVGPRRHDARVDARVENRVDRRHGNW